MTWTGFFNFLKVAGPLLAQLVGLILTSLAAHQAGKANSSGEYSITQEAGPVAGNAVAGLTLLAGGTIAQHRFAASDKAKAASEVPKPATPGVDPILNLLTLAHTAIVTDTRASKDEVDAMNKVIEAFRTPKRLPHA